LKHSQIQPATNLQREMIAAAWPTDYLRMVDHCRFDVHGSSLKGDTIVRNGRQRSQKYCI